MPFLQTHIPRITHARLQKNTEYVSNIGKQVNDPIKMP